MAEIDPKELEVARVIEEFQREGWTGKVELSFKFGKLVAGKKEVSFLK